MARYGVEVSEYHDTTATDPKNLKYSSEYQSPKLSKVYKGTFTTNGSGLATVLVTHDLNYTPVAIAFYRGPTGRWLSTDNDKIAVQTNRNNVKLVTAAASPLTASTTYTYKFWVFLDPAQVL